MHHRAKQAFVGSRLPILKNVEVIGPHNQMVTLSLKVKTSRWSSPVIEVSRPGKTVVCLPFQVLFGTTRDQLSDRQLMVAQVLRDYFRVEIALWRQEREKCKAFGAQHLTWFDPTVGFLRDDSLVGPVYWYREVASGVARVTIVEAPQGHVLETALLLNDGQPIKILFRLSFHCVSYSLCEVCCRSPRAKSIIRSFLRGRYPQPVDIDLSQVESHG